MPHGLVAGLLLTRLTVSLVRMSASALRKATHFPVMKNARVTSARPIAPRTGEPYDLTVRYRTAV